MFGNMEMQGVHQYIEEYVTKCAYFLVMEGDWEDEDWYSKRD